MCMVRGTCNAARLALLATFVTAQAPVAAAVLTVGQTGATCDAPTIEAAIAMAVQLGDHNELRITRDVAGGAWLEQHLYVEDLDLDIVGGFDTCDDDSPTGRTEMLTRDGEPLPVLTIRGASSVGLQGMVISGGSGSDTYPGGGIDFRGSGSLTLAEVALISNGRVGMGSHSAALVFNGASGGATLRFLDNVSISDNLSTGVHMLGNARLVTHGRGNTISRNGQHGLLLEDVANVDIGGTDGMFSGNQQWGVVSAQGGGLVGEPRTSRIYSIDPLRPLQFSANGQGAIAMLGSTADVSHHRLCTKNIRIIEHTPAAAPGFGLIHLEGSSVDLAMNTGCNFPPEADIDCAPEVCNLIGGNSRPADGALVQVSHAAAATVDRVVFQGNVASSIVAANVGTFPSDSRLEVRNSLIVGNVLVNTAIFSGNGARVIADGLTVADNLGTFMQSLYSADPAEFTIADSIVDQAQDVLFVDGSTATTHLDRVLARNRSGIDGDDTVIIGEPTYVVDTYRLTPDSPGIDQAPESGGLDLEGNARTVDTVEIPDGDGPRDLGAYELQTRSLEYIFADGLEIAL